MEINNIHVFSGGGVRGIISLRLAEKISIQPKMVCGTSTGAIIAAARSLNYSYPEILNLYLQNVDDIFQPRIFSLDGAFAPKYKSENLKKVISGIFGNATNKDCEKELMINAYDITRKKPKFWKSWDAETWKISDAVIASCSAPTYFEPYKISDCQFIDGGIDSNNICDSAIIEAMSRYSGFIDLILIGTGEAETKIKIKNGGILEWGTQLIDVMMDANQKSSIYKTQEIVNLRGNIDIFQVLNVKIDSEIKLDDVSKKKYMLNMKI